MFVACRPPASHTSSLSDLNVKPLISLGLMFLARKTKFNDINMLSVTRTSKSDRLLGGVIDPMNLPPVRSIPQTNTRVASCNANT